MRLSPRLGFRLVLVAIAVAIICLRLIPHHHPRTPAHSPIPDLAATNPLNQPGGGAAPSEAYEVYSTLYQAPAGEPLVFADESRTDIPQVGGSCLKPSTRGRARDDRRFCRSQPAKSSLGTEIHDPAGISAVDAERNRPGPGLSSIPRSVFCFVRRLQAGAACALSGSSWLRPHPHPRPGLCH